MNSTDFANYSNFDWQLEHSQEYKWEKKGDKVYDEVLDLLPCDPFGMGLSSRFTTFSWLEGMGNDLDLDSLTFSSSEKVEVGDGYGDERLFAEEGDDSVVDEASVLSGEQFSPGLRDDDLVLGSTLKELIEFHYDSSVEEVTYNDVDEHAEVEEVEKVDEGDPPHDGLFYALGYLGVKELMCVERVCKPLSDAVRYDPLLWKNIYIDYPLSQKITDFALLDLTDRAQGSLQCLNLTECLKITDVGLGEVLRRNPQIRKLSVPGCLGLSVEGILSNLKDLRSTGRLGLKVLRISGLDGVTDEKFEELKSLLKGDGHRHLSAHRPRFFGGGTLYLSCEDDRFIDIEKCPTCDRYGQVFDCTSQSCSSAAHSCRGCTFCIARCIHCGRCIRELDYMETFCLDLLCLDCWSQLLSCQREENSENINSSDYITVHSWEGYHVYLHG